MSALLAVRHDGLVVDRLRVSFGGVVAVDHASLAAPTGRITGLIGPNGAGKTTTFNACSGLVRAGSGRIHLDGKDVTGKSAAARARLGLGRTFQLVQLCRSLSVRENIALGAEVRMVGRNPLRQFTSSHRERQQVRARTDQAMETCGIAHLADSSASTLSTGQLRLLELARVIAGDYRLLLLDEPSSGLDEAETAQFGAILRAIVDDRGLGILLVEHDMSLVMAVCEYIYVLDFGSMIFEGSPEQTRQSSVVRRAYLGDDITVEPGA